MNYNIRPSKTTSPGREFSLEKLQLSFGEMISGGCTFAIGRKDIPVRVSKEGYITRLRWIHQRHFVFWDEDEKRGHLVNGTSALLHLLRGSLDNSRRDDFSTEFLLDIASLVEPGAPFQPNSAIAFLIDAHNRELKLYKTKEESYVETVRRPDGHEESATRTMVKYMTLEDRVDELYEALEKIIDHNLAVERGFKGIDLRLKLRKHLSGWEFSDLATSKDPFCMKVAKLPGLGPGWVELIQTIGVVTLFGRGFGDILASPTTIPGCTRWTAVPPGSHHLGVSISDLRRIVDAEGDGSKTPITIARDFMWYNPSSNCPFAPCGFCSGSGSFAGHLHVNPVQEILPSWCRRLLPSDGLVDPNWGDKGAVIFGANPSFMGIGPVQEHSTPSPTHPQSAEPYIAPTFHLQSPSPSTPDLQVAVSTPSTSTSEGTPSSNNAQSMGVESEGPRRPSKLQKKKWYLGSRW